MGPELAIQINTNITHWERWRQVAAACAALAVVAAFLPWYAGFSAMGIRFGGGQVTVLCGIAGLAFAFAWHADDRGHGVVQLVLGGVVAYVGLSNLNNFSGMGLYLTLIAGVAWFVAGMALAREYGLS